MHRIQTVLFCLSVNAMAMLDQKGPTINDVTRPGRGGQKFVTMCNEGESIATQYRLDGAKNLNQLRNICDPCTNRVKFKPLATLLFNHIKFPCFCLIWLKSVTLTKLKLFNFRNKAKL